MVLVAVIAAVGATVGGSPTDSYPAYREKAAAEVNARLAKLVGTVTAKGFPGRRGVTCKASLSITG